MAMTKSCGETSPAISFFHCRWQTLLTSERSDVRNRILEGDEDRVRECQIEQSATSLLETGLLHLLGSSDSVAADGLDTLGVEIGILLRLVLVLEADVAFLGEEDTRKVDLRTQTV